MSVDPDVQQAYMGRLGQVDSYYADPNLANIVSLSAPEPAPEQPPPPETSPGTVGEPQPEPAPEPPAEPPDVPVEDLTVEQLKDELDGWGVEYSHGDRKADLQEKLRVARGA
jgi:hypothetical protein